MTAAQKEPLASAQATVAGLRDQCEALVAARTRAETEARRLGALSEQGDDVAAELVRRYLHQSSVLTTEIGILRASLRGAEARLAALRPGGAG